MRHGTPWLLWLALALLVLVGAIAVLQYRWLGEVSQAGRQRLTSTLQARAEQFAEELDRDVAGAYFWLQVEPAVLDARDWTRYVERYERWLAGAAHPRLVREVWLFAPDAPARRFSPASRAFVNAPIPPALEPIAAQSAAEFSGRTDPAPMDLKWFHAIHDDIPAIVAPIPQVVFFSNPAGRRDLRIQQLNPLAHRGYTVIVLDDRYIRTELLPKLAERAFGAAGTSDYHVSVRSRGDGREVFSYGPPPQHVSAAPDLTLSLFDVRLDTVAALRSATLGDASLEAGRALPGEKPRLTVSVIRREGAAGRAGRMSLPGPRWQLTARHRAGSLEAAVVSARRRNLAMSGGILVLFAASVMLLVMSVQRASRLAAQQMDFVAAVSHELRTPLAVIRSAGENLADGVVAEQDQVRRYGELVRNEGLRLSSMVEQVLAFAGMRGEQALRVGPERIGEILERAIAHASADLQAAGLSVEMSVPSDLPRVMVDGQAISRAVANLLTNAAKYARDGGQVRLVATVERVRRAEELRIAVQDRGPGIAPADLPHIFEPFYRAASVIASQTRGTGLGLSLVQAIARAHGGRVSVESALHGGSVFTLHLPCAAADARQAASAPLPASRS